MLKGRLRGFTLIELLVVISIMSLLMAILLPALTSAKKSAQTAMCLSNVKQLGVASRVYLNTNNDAYPHAMTAEPLAAWPHPGAYYITDHFSYHNGYHADGGWPTWTGYDDTRGMMLEYVNFNYEVLTCPMFWPNQRTGAWDNWVAVPNFGGNQIIDYGMAPHVASYAPNVNMSKGCNLNSCGDATGDGVIDGNDLKFTTTYEIDVKRPGQCSNYMDTYTGEHMTHYVAPPSVAYSWATSWWPGETTFGTDFPIWTGNQPGMRHEPSTRGYNVVFCDGHADTVAAWTHYDFMNADDTYFALDP